MNEDLFPNYIWDTKSGVFFVFLKTLGRGSMIMVKIFHRSWNYFVVAVQFSSCLLFKLKVFRFMAKSSMPNFATPLTQQIVIVLLVVFLAFVPLFRKLLQIVLSFKWETEVAIVLDGNDEKFAALYNILAAILPEAA